MKDLQVVPNKERFVSAEDLEEDASIIVRENGCCIGFVQRDFDQESVKYVYKVVNTTTTLSDCFPNIGNLIYNLEDKYTFHYEE